MIIKGKKSNDETCIQNPQSCAWLVVRQNQCRTKDPSQICGHQKPTCWPANQRKFHAWRVEPSSSFVQYPEFFAFSCRHFSNFLSESIGKQSAMSKRGQEETSSEGSPMAKLKPVIPAKARPINLVSYSPWSARENPPQDLWYPVNPRECRWRTRLSDKYKETCTDHQNPRSRMFSSEATGKCSKFRFLETRRQGGIVKLC